MLPPPYAPAVYFGDNSYIVFGEGEIGLPSRMLQYAELEEEEEEEEEETHTNASERRYNNWKSNILTVLDLRLSGEEQQERNKEACRLNFGDWWKGENEES